MAKGGKKLKIPDLYVWGGLAVVGALGVGAYLVYQDPQLINKLLGHQQPATVAAVQPNMEMEEAEALKLGLDPYKPTVGGGGFSLTQGGIPSMGNVGGGTHVGETGQKTGPFGIKYPVPQGPGAGGFTPSPRCQFNPSDLPIATLETAKQFVRIIDWPVSPITNTIPRLEQCYYSEIARYVNAGPNNPVYLAVEQVACAISSGVPFPVRNAASLKAAQVAKRQINQGNCLNQYLTPVPKRADPVPVLESARAKSLRARRAMMAKYSYYAHGGS